MSLAGIDLTDTGEWPDEELELLLAAVLTERERRRTLASMPAVIERMTADYQQAAGIGEGTQYRPPTGAHDVVPAGETRVFEGALWRNISGRPLAHSPAEYPDGWELVDDDAEPVVPDPDDHPAWAVDVTYRVGDVVTFEGVVYRCVQGHSALVGWTPPVVPALWSPV